MTDSTDDKKPKPTMTERLKPQRSPEELDLSATLERMAGRKLAEHEIDLSLDQARALGEL
jgi:hypothetical protein